MFLFIGLGNKGSKYQNNRHNTGFLFVDYLVKKYGLLKTNNKLKGPEHVPYKLNCSFSF